MIPFLQNAASHPTLISIRFSRLRRDLHQAKADTTSFLLDVRTSKEYAEGHLAGAHQLDYLNPEAFDAGIKQLDKSRTYYIYCRSGKRSHGACLKMQQQGFKIYDMESGILNWTKLGMPVER
jgi:rhodanese-related sulfurtransferase